jgi:acetyltransferase
VARTGMRRALAPSERVHAIRETYIGYTVRATGRLDEDALAAAYDAVCLTYPQLSARIEADENGFALVESDARPAARIVTGDPDRPLAGLDVDQHRALSGLNVVRNGDEASVCLAVQHSIADAYHALEVFAALWSRYTDVLGGVPAHPARHPFPRSLEELLAERGIHAKGPAATAVPAPLASGSPAAGPPDPLVRHVVQHRLTTAETTALVDLGHREHVTINGLLCGVVLRTEAAMRDLPLTDLILRYTANLRRRLYPPVGPAEGTNVLGGVGFKAPGGIGSDALAIGRAIGEHLRAGLADGSVQRSLLDMLSGPRGQDAKPWDPNQVLAVVSVMNWGVVPPLRTPDGLVLTNFHSASRMRDSTALGGYVVNTFDGRIGIDLAWPESDPRLPRRVDRLREELSRLIRPA